LRQPPQRLRKGVAFDLPFSSHHPYQTLTPFARVETYYAAAALSLHRPFAQLATACVALRRFGRLAGLFIKAFIKLQALKL